MGISNDVFGDFIVEVNGKVVWDRLNAEERYPSKQDTARIVDLIKNA